MASLQFFQDGGPFRGRAVALLQAAQFALPRGEFPLQVGKLLLGRCEEPFARVGAAGEFLALLAQGVQFGGQARQLPVQLGDAVAAALPDRLGRGRLAFQHAGLAGQAGGQPHLLQAGRPPLLVLAADMIEPGHQVRQRPFAFRHPLRDRALPLLGVADGLRGVVELLFQVVGPGAQGEQLPPVAGDFLLQLAAAGTFVLDGRFLAGDPLAVGGDPRFGLADGLVDLADPAVRFQQPGLARFGRGQQGVALGGQRLEFLLAVRQPLGQTPPIDQPHLGAKLLEAVGIFLVAAGLAGLARTVRNRLSTSSMMSDSRSRF